MPKIVIKPETFVQDGVNPHGDVVGTVEIEMGNQTVTARAYKWSTSLRGEQISVHGFIGRYRTVNTPWIANVTLDLVDGRLFVNFGRDDRSGRFNKQNAISWEPATYERIGNMPYWMPAKEG